MAKEHVSPLELREKLKEYSKFIDSTLHPELKRTVSAREETQDDIREYHELYDKLIVMNHNREQKEETPPLEALANMGHELCYCTAVVEDPSTVFIDVGLGFFVELTLDEALSVILKRIAFLETKKLPKRIEDARKVAADVESSIIMLEALARDLQEMEAAAR
jgi:prefoldin subunit 5